MNPSQPDLLTKVKKQIDSYKFRLRLSEQGRVVSVGDGVAWIEGLPSVAMDEIILFEDGSQGMVFHLTENLVGAVLLHQTETLAAGTMANHANLFLSIPVGDELLGRVVDPLGLPLDGLETPPCHERYPLDVLSPPIIDRDFVNQPLYTGNKILDTLIPIGKGQRELIIGDNGLGKSSLAIDTVINQKDKNVRCVYVLIGQNRSNVVNVIQLLKDANALSHTAIVVAEATALPGLIYLAPYAGCTIAERWMKAGMDTLVVYDDLTTHADSYRELSLLLRRPPGREAYPADIFYLHARLLERSTCLNSEKGGGSMTTFPIIETKEGEIATYIPTNLISITDGQIFFDAKLFSSGFLPAIDITKSVSRIGGKAQHAAIKNEAARMKLDYLQFLELEVFTRFGAKLDPAVQKQIQRGRILREILKQDRLMPLSIEFQMAWLVAFNDGFFDHIEIEKIPNYLQKLGGKITKVNFRLSSVRSDWQYAIKLWFETEALRDEKKEH
jgi:F-type H+/Na+-transporting ATPase subunit alpha